jgi:hypothetical protein
VRTARQRGSPRRCAARSTAGRRCAPGHARAAQHADDAGRARSVARSVTACRAIRRAVTPLQVRTAMRVDLAELPDLPSFASGSSISDRQSRPAWPSMDPSGAANRQQPSCQAERGQQGSFAPGDLVLERPKRPRERDDEHVQPGEYNKRLGNLAARHRGPASCHHEEPAQAHPVPP